MADEPHPYRLRVAVTDAAGRPVRAGTLAAWLRAIAPASARGELTIAFVSDQTMRRLNRQFAGKDRATDVLSFPAFARDAIATGSSAGRPATTRTGRPSHLGDIVIATGVARRQACDAGHPYAQELRVLALHGLLHLLGYDHETDGGAMARLEARLRRKGGLQAGVIERARPA